MALLIIILSILLAWLAWRFLEPFTPAWFFAFMWAVQLFMAATLLQVVISFYFMGLLYIVILCCCMMAGTIVLPPATAEFEAGRTMSEWRAGVVLAVLLLLAAGNPLLAIIQNGFDLSEMFSLETLLEMSNEMAESRYDQTLEVSLYSQILLVFLYLAALYGGYCYVLGNRRLKALCLLTLLPSVVVALTQAMKMNFMTSVMLFLTGALVSCVSNGIPVVINRRKWLWGIGGSVVFLAFLYLTMMFRLGQINEKASTIVSQKFIAYATGHLPCFDTWFTEMRTDEEPLHFGAHTFYALSNTLGIEKREQGIYQERLVIGKNGFEGEANVYTAFRPLVEDFGVYGAPLFMLLFGYLSQLWFCRIRRWKRAYLSETLLCSAYAYVLWSYVTSFYSYLSYIVAFFLFYVLLHFTYDEVPVDTADET